MFMHLARSLHRHMSFGFALCGRLSLLLMPLMGKMLEIRESGVDNRQR